MAPTAPLHGPLSDRVAIVTVHATVRAVQNALTGLHRLDTATVAGSSCMVGTLWMGLLTTLFAPVTGPVPPLSPNATQVAAVIAGATEQERRTVLEILAEASFFLSFAARRLDLRLQRLPSAYLPEGWQDTLATAYATSRSLQLAACPQGSSPEALTATLVGLLAPRP